MIDKKSAVVICPGRGTYNQAELGYLGRYATGDIDFVDAIDAQRTQLGQVTISELDGMDRFSTRVHTTGENASPLIYACAMNDFASIDLEAYDLVAVGGNSMGWYLALACAGVLRGINGFHLVNTMGSLMQEEGVGGQVIYSLVDDQWRFDKDAARVCDNVSAELNSHPGTSVSDSILLGGMRVMAANEAGIKGLLEKLPPRQDRYPFQLQHHAAFHSDLLAHIPGMAQNRILPEAFEPARLPLIDGRGVTWQPGAIDYDRLYQYTLSDQITQPYNFSKLIEVAVKEFAPDCIILLGPGSTLGPPIAQELIRQAWLGLETKDEFIARQATDPFLLSMGIEEQRKRVV